MRNMAYKYRLLPNEEQAQLINKTVGCARLMYNSLLMDYKQQLNSKVDKPRLKLTTFFNEQYTFLKEVDSLALMNARQNLKSAFDNFFKSRKGERKGRRVGFPKCHKKSKSKLSYTTNSLSGTIRINENKIKLPKLGWINFVKHRELQGLIKHATIEQTRDGKYYVSIIVELPDKVVTKRYTNRVVGLDMSFKEFVVDSDNTSNDMKPKYVRLYRSNERRLKRLQRRLSKRVKDSNNYNKARVKVAKLHCHITNCRMDFCHKMSRYYVDNYDVIVLEDINLQDMTKHGLRGHAKSINDMGFGMFRDFIKYKAEDSGAIVVKVDKWYPSSKTCNHCGYVNKQLSLSDRQWICPNCGAIIERDENAACNLRDCYLRNINTAGTAGIYACGDSVPTIVSNCDSKQYR